MIGKTQNWLLVLLSSLTLISIGLPLLLGIEGCVSSEAEQGRWDTGAPSLTKRTEVALAEVGGLIYLIGGLEEQTHEGSSIIVVTNSVEVYDPQKDQWHVTASLPVRLHHAGAASLNGQLYVVGGFSPTESSIWRNSVNTIYRYNPASDEWSMLAPMKTNRGALGVSVFGGKLYAIGGYDGKSSTATVEVYDPKANSWSTVSPIPTPRDHLAVVTVGPRIYAIGGRTNWDYNQNLAKVEVYEPDSGKWKSVADLPTPRSGITAGVHNNQIYVLGGESGKGTFSEHEKYNPQTDSWQKLSALPTARHGLGSAVIGNRLYVISGGPSPGASFSNLNEIFIFG